MLRTGWAFAVLLGVGPAFGQFMPSTPRPPKGAAAAPAPNQPVTHAAAGASDEEMRLGGTEPRLPAAPLAVSPELRLRLRSDADRDREQGRGTQAYRFWLGPWYHEQSGEYSFKTLAPFWVERKQPDNDRASLFGGLYYNRRSPKHDADVLFPLFWNLRDEDNRTTVVGPVVHRSAPDAHDTWVAPLFFQGSRTNGSGYLHLVPPLFITHHTQNSGFNFALGFYCSWTGGSSCSPSRATDISYGIAPLLYFAGKTERSRYEFAAPLLHYYQNNEVEDRWVNVWGPFIWSHRKETDAFHVAPLFWHSWGKNEDSLTILPFFHYSYKGNSSLFVNPLFLSARGEKGDSTFATYLYARYRGRTTLDMVTPLFWRYTDPDIGLSRYVVPPFLYSSTSPRGSDLAIFPFYGRFTRPGIRDTTWVTPFFSHTHDLTGWSTNIYPFLYTGRTYDATHTVVFPFFWDFASSKSRTTIGLPLLWRFADERQVSELVGNVYYHERKVPGGLDWQVHVFPAFSYGETPQGHWWNVLFGLAGYSREGAATKMRLLYVPIPLSGGAEE